MFIVGKDKETVANTEFVTNIYIGIDNCSIKANFIDGKGCQIAKYNSEEQAQIAMEILLNDLEKGKSGVCIFMPDENAIKAKLNSKEQKYHHLTGKKTKGHGGS